MWDAISAAFKALQAGEQLENSATWKVRQNAVNALIGLIGALIVIAPYVGIHMPMPSADDITTIAGGIAIIGGIVNNYLTTATTKTIGTGSAVVVDPSVPVVTPPLVQDNPDKGA